MPSEKRRQEDRKRERERDGRDLVAGVRYRCRRDTGVARIAVTATVEG